MSDAAQVRVCPKCGTQSPVDFHFCGLCGNRLDDVAPTASKTQYFSTLQTTQNARLVLIRGGGSDGVSYPVSETEQIMGRSEGSIVFPDDPFLSPRHASFHYSSGEVIVRDQGSANGVFVRIRHPTPIASGSVFLVGEQLLQVESCSADVGPQLDDDGTCFYASPRRPSRMQLVQRLRGGDIGMVLRARGDSLTVGRENNDVNFPDDPFISGHHARVSWTEEGNFVIADLGSKNGTFVRITEEAALASGDYIFLGQQLLRVEITAP